MKRLPPAQETVLLRKHLTGDFGKHRFSTVRALLDAGMLRERNHELALTDKGRAYCDEHHLSIRS